MNEPSLRDLRVLGGATRSLAPRYVCTQLSAPAFLESAYRACLGHELLLQGLRVQPEWHLPISYRGLRIDVGYRVDLLVEETIIVELKAVESLLRVHEAQLLAYLKLSGLSVGLRINFCVPHLRLGIKRMVNYYSEKQRTDRQGREGREG